MTSCHRLGLAICVGPGCLGHSDPKACDHLARRADWNALSDSEQIAHAAARMQPTFSTVRDGRINVGVLTVSSGMGGAERWISDLFAHCDSSRIRWVGVAMKHDVPPGWPSLKAEWQAVCPVATGDEALRSLGLAIDVLVTWGVVDFQWGISPAKLDELVPADVPIIQTSHGSIEYGTEASKSRAIPVAVSQAALRGLAPSKRADARIILNCVSPVRVEAKRSRAEVRQSWGIPSGNKVVGYLGRISPEKQPRLFVEGVNMLPDHWSAVMVGPDVGGHTPANLGRVIMAGTDPDVGSVLGAIDCMVMTSDTEACSLAAAEAWLAGVPLISTPVGLLEDHPDLARVMPPNPTPIQVAAAILADESYPEFTARRVDQAQAFARTRMSPEEFGLDWTKLLCSLASKRPSTRSRLDPAVRDAVNNCPSRGPELPVSAYIKDGCCSGPTRYSCSEGKGKVPGQPTLEFCLGCKGPSR